MDERIQMISEATGLSPQKAAELLAAANGDVDAVVNQFFSESADMDDGVDDDPLPPSPPKASSSRGSPAPQSVPAKKPEKPKSRVATFADFQNDEPHDHSDDEDPQEFFAGGKASGVAIQGPQGGKGNASKDAIEKIINSAQEQGKKEMEREAQTQSQPKKPKTFVGAGNKLGDGTEPTSSSPLPQAQAPSQQQQQEPQELEELTYTLHLWEDGFSVDDGPLRNPKDPENERFLKELGEGFVPLELRAKKGQPVKVMVNPRPKEKYVPPKKVMKPFSGSGNRLGSEVPGEVVGSSSSPAPPSSSSSSSQPPSSAPAQLLVNPNEPTTTVQIRLADGTKLVAKFNPTQTVGDIIRFINMTKAGESQRNYIIMTTFPNKELLDLTATIEAAGLMNAVVVQRYK